MIRTFRDSRTEAAFEGASVPMWHPDLTRRAMRKLHAVDAAASLADLRAMPGNRLEKLRGDRTGQWSIRVNGRWRICFEWIDGHAELVELVDYH
jgi:proteic killer suppression protein